MERLRDGDWDGLADEVRSRRDELGWGQDELAQAAGVSRATVQSIERGERRGRWPSRMAAVERALGWLPGSARRRVLDGVRPTTAGAEPQPAPPAPMARAVKDEWRRQVEASPMSPRAKRENLAFIDTIPDAD